MPLPRPDSFEWTLTGGHVRSPQLLETINTAGPQPSLERWEDMATEFAIRGLDPNLASVSKAEPSIEVDPLSCALPQRVVSAGVLLCAVPAARWRQGAEPQAPQHLARRQSSKKLRVNSPVRGMAVVPGLAEEVRVRPGSDPVFFYGHLHRSPIRGIEAPCPARPCPQLASQCSVRCYRWRNLLSSRWCGRAELGTAGVAAAGCAAHSPVRAGGSEAAPFAQQLQRTRELGVALAAAPAKSSQRRQSKHVPVTRALPMCRGGKNGISKAAVMVSTDL